MPHTARAAPEKATFDQALTLLQSAKQEVQTRIIGQDEVVDHTLITLACGGHALLVGVPGLAKTLLVETIARVMGLTSARVQCTPDLMPADILGSEVLEDTDSKKRAFRFIEGPVFTQLLMADEINRANPRTQSALLQAMQERTVSVSGKARPLPSPFHVLATQNPIEQEGTYPLPEAQLDRFLMQIDVPYPSEAAERAIYLATTTGQNGTVEPKMTPIDLLSIQSLIREMPIGEELVDAILHLVRQCRPSETAPKNVNDYVEWPAGPRAGQALMLGCRARALLNNRTAPSIEDVKQLAYPILQHRMTLNYKASRDQITLKSLIESLTQSL